MTTISRLFAASALVLIGAAAQASEVKVAFNGADDPKTNAEAAFVHGFAKALKDTGFDVKAFPSDTLGSEKERYDQVSQGLIEVDLAALSSTFGQSPFAKGIQLPFFFQSRDELDAVAEKTNVLDMINEPLLENGVRMVGLNYIGMDIGIHNTKRPISKVSDLEGLRFRALNTEQLALQQALGATGTIISWSEVANALQTGVADGYFNPPNSAIRTGHTEFLKFYTPVDLTPSTRVVLISSDWYDSLSDEDKSLIDSAIAAGVKANRDWVNAWAGEVRAKQDAAGVTVTELEPGEREKMADLARATWSTSLSEAQLQAWKDAQASVSK